MYKTLWIGAAATALLISAAGGFWFGARPSSMVETPSAQAPIGDMAAAPKAARKILYWEHPDGVTDFSPEPKTTADGQAYVAVFNDEEKGIGDAPEIADGPVRPQGERKIKFYRNPMGLPDTSPEPKKDWMGMDYIPVYEGEDGGADHTVKVSLDKVQRSGVRSEEVRMTSLSRPFRVPGVAKPDERTLRVVSLRADAFIEKVYVNESGKHVKAGEPLFQVYSPQFLRALIEAKTGALPGVVESEQKLKVLEIPQSVIDDARKSKRVVATFDYPAPSSGVVMEKMVVEGMMMKMGEPLYKLVDLSSIWVIADVPEQEMGRLKIGNPVDISFRALPGEKFTGNVTFVLHELDPITRTGHVRIEVKNPDHRIKHEMYAEVVIDSGADDGPKLTVPTSAVIDSGSRQVVLVERGEGRFEPRPVKLGVRGDGVVEIMAGLKVGEKVVVSANFLIDAESNLKAALASFTADGPKAADAPPAPVMPTESGP
ncbi:MAG: efflux RND transporter periplasmic adaptor subunit [Hyphomicrobium sp.]